MNRDRSFHEAYKQHYSYSDIITIHYNQLCNELFSSKQAHKPTPQKQKNKTKVYLVEKWWSHFNKIVSPKSNTQYQSPLIYEH